jgi:hypothetical protein
MGEKPQSSRLARRRRKVSARSEPSTVARSLETIKRYELRPEEIDEAILAAINVSLCLESDGDDLVAEGFNHDLVINGRAFARR